MVCVTGTMQPWDLPQQGELVGVPAKLGGLAIYSAGRWHTGAESSHVHSTECPELDHSCRDVIEGSGCFCPCMP